MKFIEKNPIELAKRVSIILDDEEIALNAGNMWSRKNFSDYRAEAATKIALFLLDHEKILNTDFRFIKDFILNINNRDDAMIILVFLATIIDIKRDNDVEEMLNIFRALELKPDSASFKRAINAHSVVFKLIIEYTALTISHQFNYYNEAVAFVRETANDDVAWSVSPMGPQRNIFQTNNQRFFIDKCDYLPLLLDPNIAMNKIIVKKNQLENNWFYYIPAILKLERIRKPSLVIDIALDILSASNERMPRYFLKYAGNRVRKCRNRIKTNSKYYKKYTTFINSNCQAALEQVYHDSFITLREDRERDKPDIPVPTGSFRQLDKVFIRRLFSSEIDLTRYVRHVHIKNNDPSRVLELGEVLLSNAECLLNRDERKRVKKRISRAFAATGIHLNKKKWVDSDF